MKRCCVFAVVLVWFFMAVQQIHSKSNKWKMNFDFLWTFSVVANHRPDHGHSLFIIFYLFITDNGQCHS